MKGKLKQANVVEEIALSNSSFVWIFWLGLWSDVMKWIYDEGLIEWGMAELEQPFRTGRNIGRYFNEVKRITCVQIILNDSVYKLRM